MKIPNKKELQQIVFYDSSDIDSQDFVLKTIFLFGY